MQPSDSATSLPLAEQSQDEAVMYDVEKKRNAHTAIIIGLAGLLNLDLGPDPKTKKEQENQDRLYNAIRWHVRAIINGHDYLKNPNYHTARMVGKPCQNSDCWQGHCIGPDCKCKCHVTLNRIDATVRSFSPDPKAATDTLAWLREESKIERMPGGDVAKAIIYDSIADEIERLRALLHRQCAIFDQIVNQQYCWECARKVEAANVEPEAFNAE